MKQSPALRVLLTGGPHDGEVAILVPDPGVGPPQLLCYYANRRETETEAHVMDVYEIWPPIPCYPEWDGINHVVECMAFHQGVASLKYREDDNVAAEGLA